MSSTDKHTPIRTVRVGEELWRAAQAKAAALDTSVSDVLRTLLGQWVGQPTEEGTQDAQEPNT